MRDDGRPDHIEDWLCKHKSGQWFGWSDPTNKIYVNLITHDGSKKPTQAECATGLQLLQQKWDAASAPYKRKRGGEYPSIADQLDRIYHDGIDAWKASIKTIKDKYPKS